MDDTDLKRAAGALVLQAYAAKKYGSPAPSRMQWVELASALETVGVRLPSDWAAVMSDGAL